MRIEIKKEESYTRIYIDGEEVHRVVSYELKECVGESPRLVLELIPDTIAVDVDGDVEKNPHYTLSEKDKEMKEGYKDFIRFLFRGAVDAGKNRNEP